MRGDGIPNLEVTILRWVFLGFGENRLPGGGVIRISSENQCDRQPAMTGGGCELILKELAGIRIADLFEKEQGVFEDIPVRLDNVLLEGRSDCLGPKIPNQALIAHGTPTDILQQCRENGVPGIPGE